MTTTSGPSLRGVQRLAAVGRLAHHFHVGLGVEQGPEALADDGVVLGQEHA